MRTRLIHKKCKSKLVNSSSLRSHLPLKKTQIRNSNSQTFNNQTSITQNTKTSPFFEQQQPKSAPKNHIQFYFAEKNQVQSYLSQIYSYISELDSKAVETASKGSQMYLGGEISLQMRKVLVKWLTNLSKTLKLQFQTLHLCVQLIDETLTKEPTKINKSNFQLLGVTCLYVATKMIEIYKFDVKIFIAACEGFYKLHELFQMEILILLVTKFQLNKPTIYEFLSIKIARQSTCQTKKLMENLANLCIFDYSLLNLTRKENIANVIEFLAQNSLQKCLYLDNVENENDEEFKMCSQRIKQLSLQFGLSIFL